MLIVFPIGLWIFSLACDAIRLAGAASDAWSTVAFFSMVGGFIPVLLSIIGAALIFVSGWLGSQMVHVLVRAGHRGEVYR